MCVKLLVIDEFAETEKVFGFLDNYKLQQVIDIARKKGLRCLTFIDQKSDTYFNEPQLNELKKEIEILKNYPQLDKDLLLLIEKGRTFARDAGGFTYLKFEVT